MLNNGHSGMRRAVNPQGVPVLPGSSAAVVAGGFVFTGSMLAFGPDLRLHLASRVNRDSVPEADPLELQAAVLMQNLRATLGAAGSDIGRDVLRIWQWTTARYPSNEDYEFGPIVWPPFHSGDGYARVAKTMLDSLRTSTGIGVRQLPLSDGCFAVDVLAVLPRDGEVKQGFPDNEADDVLPFVSTIRFGDWVTTAAGPSDFRGDWKASIRAGEPSLVAMDARVNPYIWLGSEIEAQTEWTLSRLAAAAQRAGTDLQRCVYADVTLCHPSDYQGFDRVWRRWFPAGPPARKVTTGARIVVKGVRVEIALFMSSIDSTLEREAIEVGSVAPPIGHAPHAVRVGELLFVSTRLPLDATHSVPTRLRRDDGQRFLKRTAYEQAKEVLQDLSQICDAARTEIANVCKAQIFMDDLDHLPDLLDAWAETFPNDPPALAVMGMGGGQPLLAPHAMLQLDAIAWVPPRP